ncbi:hypothetical protein [Microcella alkaliphila]|uniref:hypothetical protein n=1 Tax=Microcella alkaliphila TaxID=279828 RepID=UPI0012379F69|nr:hypothetical protein [Microcella alkaliphila]
MPDESDRENVAKAIPSDALGWLIYGSAARRDTSIHSDVDIIAIVPTNRKSRSFGRINATYYTMEKLSSSSGTIFGQHLRSDAVVMADTQNVIETTLGSFRAADPELVMHKLRRAAVALTSSNVSHSRYLPGVVRLSRYLLRTAMYAHAIQRGAPCFSVRQLAKLHGDPGLIQLLSSHETEQTPMGARMLEDLLQRLFSIIGEVEVNPFGTVEGFIVGRWNSDPDSSNTVLLTIGRSSQDIPYNEIPRVVL